VTGGRLNVNKALNACKGPAAPPPAPTSLQASAANAQVALQWNASAGATSYIVKRSTTSGSESFLNSTAQTSYTDSAAVNGTQYYYVVVAVQNGVESGPSNEVNATPTAPPPPTPPAAPTALMAAGGPSKKKITLNWSAVAGAASYKVKRSTISGGPYTTVATGVTGTTYVNSGLTSNRTYYYVVSAVNAVGESPNSFQASAKAQ
jgi:cellulose 1,4-beta-cellobiosidase